MPEECLTPSVKHGGGNVMVWGCFDADKVGDLYKVKGILNKEGYHSILQCHAIPCGQRLNGDNFLLQQDNDPKHTSKLCNNYLVKKQSAGILSVRSGQRSHQISTLLSCCGSSLTVWYIRSARQANPTCGRCFRKCGVKFLQITSTKARMPKFCKAVIAAN